MSFFTFTDDLILRKNDNIKYISKRDDKREQLPWTINLLCSMSLQQYYPIKNYRCCTGAHSQLWRTIISVCSSYAPRKYDKRVAHLQLSNLQGEDRPIPNQELLEAKSELPGGTVGVCSFHRRCGQLPYNLPIIHLRFTPRSRQVCLLAHFNKWSIYE